jgi:hypothetical protein
MIVFYTTTVDVTHLDLVRNASRGSPTIRPSMVSSVD